MSRFEFGGATKLWLCTECGLEVEESSVMCFTVRKYCKAKASLFPSLFERPQATLNSFLGEQISRQLVTLVFASDSGKSPGLGRFFGWQLLHTTAPLRRSRYYTEGRCCGFLIFRGRSGVACLSFLSSLQGIVGGVSTAHSPMGSFCRPKSHPPMFAYERGHPDSREPWPARFVS